MTIPSRPAPPPPKPTAAGSTSRSASQLSHSASSAAAFGRRDQSLANQARYSTTSWDDDTFMTSPFGDELNPTNSRPTKRLPPPRPPPPKLTTTKSSQPPLLRKPTQPQSVNILSNLFGGVGLGGGASRRTSNGAAKSTVQHKVPPKLPPPPQATTPAATAELIDFNSPPSSPTLTQKSNSDCVSVDSFSSDSNYSPHNGFSSQPESGFEDELSGDTYSTAHNTDPWDDPFTVRADVGARPAKPVIAQKPTFFTNPTSVNSSGGKPSPQRSVEFYDPLCNGKSLLPPTPVLQMPTIIKPTIKEKPKLLPQTGTRVVLGDLKSGEQSPPMPMCAPPPPPVEFFADTPTTVATPMSVDSSHIGQVVALYSFDGPHDEDLSFKEGDKLEVIKKIDDEWYYGRDKRGCEGVFPINYVNKISPESEDVAYVRVLYDFAAQAPEDLSIKMGDTVTIFYRINDEWLFGQKGPYQGQFPANFVDHIPSNLPTMPY